MHRCLLRNESRLEIVFQDPVERAGKPNPYANPEERGAVVESFAGFEYVAFVCFGTNAGLRLFLRIRSGKLNPFANPEERGAVVESLTGLYYFAFVCFATKAGLR